MKRAGTVWPCRSERKESRGRWRKIWGWTRWMDTSVRAKMGLCNKWTPKTQKQKLFTMEKAPRWLDHLTSANFSHWPPWCRHNGHLKEVAIVRGMEAMHEPNKKCRFPLTEAVLAIVAKEYLNCQQQRCTPFLQKTNCLAGGNLTILSLFHPSRTSDSLQRIMFILNSILTK